LDLASRNELALAERSVIEAVARRFFLRRPPSACFELEDLLSDAWEAALRALPEWEPDLSPLRAFLRLRVRWGLLEAAKGYDPLTETQRQWVREGLWAELQFESWEWELLEERVAAIGPQGADWLFGLVALNRALGELPKRQRLLIHRVYWEGWPQAELARQEGVTAVRIGQVLRSALHRLRSQLEDPSSRPSRGHRNRPLGGSNGAAQPTGASESLR